MTNKVKKNQLFQSSVIQTDSPHENTDNRFTVLQLLKEKVFGRKQIS